MRCKGSFPTCDICNAVNNLANAGQKKWSEPELEVILKFKMNHLDQQNAAREELEEAIVQARKLDKNGQPILAVIYGDGMTADAGKTPAFKGRVGKTEKTIGNRLFGVYVCCGPIDGMFYFHMNNLVRGGANMYCTIIRETLWQLDKMLKNKGCSMPEELRIQADNCGENKSKYTNAFISLLVELGYFNLVTLAYLIVG